MIHEKYGKLVYVENLAECFGTAIYGVIDEARKLGHKISRKEVLDDELILKLIPVLEEKKSINESLQAKRDEDYRHFKCLLDKGARSNLLPSIIKLKNYTEICRAAELIVNESAIEMHVNPVQAYYFEKVLVENYISGYDYYPLIIKDKGSGDELFSLIKKRKNLSFLGEISLKEEKIYIEKSNSYIQDKLELLSKFISEFLKKYKIKTPLYGKDIILFSYVLTKDAAISIFYEKWNNDYGHYFDDINTLALREAIERYFTIDSLDYKNTIYQGIFIYYLMRCKKFEGYEGDFINCSDRFFTNFNMEQEKQKYNAFTRKVKKDNKSKILKYTINDVDLMNGLEFEKFVVELFKAMGYSAEVTKATGDQGIDVIASKNDLKIGIQAKNYSSSVSNSAIQEVVAGKNHYNLDKAIVITNNYFTESAKKLATSNHVILWDRDLLKAKIDDVF